MTTSVKMSLFHDNPENPPEPPAISRFLPDSPGYLLVLNTGAVSHSCDTFFFFRFLQKVVFVQNCGGVLGVSAQSFEVYVRCCRVFMAEESLNIGQARILFSVV